MFGMEDKAPGIPSCPGSTPTGKLLGMPGFVGVDADPGFGACGRDGGATEESKNRDFETNTNVECFCS